MDRTLDLTLACVLPPVACLGAMAACSWLGPRTTGATQTVVLAAHWSAQALLPLALLAMLAGLLRLVRHTCGPRTTVRGDRPSHRKEKTR